MTNENDDIQLPKQPEWAITTALKHGALWAAIGATIHVLATKLFKTNPEKSEVIYEALNGATFFGLLGGIYGYVTGARKHAEYPLKVENSVLKYSLQQTNEALAEKSAQHSHMAKIDAQREAEKECGSCKLRG